MDAAKEKEENAGVKEEKDDVAKEDRTQPTTWMSRWEGLTCANHGPTHADHKETGLGWLCQAQEGGLV